jgi:hypothetical protein
MRQALIGIAALLTLFAVGTAAGGRLSLYKSLRSSAFPDTALPAAFSSAKVVAAPLSSAARANGATGAVEVNVDGPDANAGILFVLFKTAAGAAADMGAAVPPVPGLQVKPAGKVGGRAQSGLFAGSFTQTDALGATNAEGATYAVIQQGNVLVAGFTYAPTRVRDGSGAVALAKAGLAHLQAVSG